MPATRIISFSTMPSQPPVPQRARPARLRALPQFSVIVAWVVSAILHHRGQDVSVVNLDSVAPALVDQVSEETIRTLAALDPIAESVARRRARQLAGDLLANMELRRRDGLIDLTDAAVVADYGNRIADAVLEADVVAKRKRYRFQLVYGSTTAPATEVKN